MYDLSYATNADGYLAVNLALSNLFVKSWLSAIQKHALYILSGKGVAGLIQGVLSLAFGDPNGMRHYAPDGHLQNVPMKNIKGAIPDIPEELVDGQRDADEWEELWVEIILMTSLAGIVAVLILWRQLLMPERPRVAVAAVVPMAPVAAEPTASPVTSAESSEAAAQNPPAIYDG